MAGDVGWKSVELQIEALIPGILILVEANSLTISWFDYRVTTSVFMPASDFVRSAIFIASAYSVGVVSSLVCRLLIDCISERGLRWIVFHAFAHHDLDRAIKECDTDDPRFENDHSHEKRNRKRPSVASWNAVYRSALRRTTRVNEVDRRRAQGRFVRNLLLPAIGAPLVMFPLPWSVIPVLVSIFLVLFLSAYAEYVSFAEAYDISGTTPR